MQEGYLRSEGAGEQRGEAQRPPVLGEIDCQIRALVIVQRTGWEPERSNSSIEQPPLKRHRIRLGSNIRRWFYIEKGNTQTARFAMIVQLMDSVAGTPVYINPAYVITLRPDPADPDHISIIKIRDGESIRVRGSDKDVADKLARAA
jgi:hypothetical protein